MLLGLVELSEMQHELDTLIGGALAIGASGRWRWRNGSENLS